MSYLEEFKLCVSIYVKDGFGNYIFSGSGFLLDQYTIITCAHVIRTLSTVKVRMPDILPEGIELNVSQINLSIDGATIKLDPPLPIFDQYPPIVDISYEDVEGLQVSVFARTELHQNGAWTDFIIGKQIRPGLIEGFQVDKGYLIEAGYSGSPVWLNDYKGIIGMVKSADPERAMVNFIGGKDLADNMGLSTYAISHINTPRLPEAYTRVKARYATIERIIDSLHNHDQAMLIVYGADGMGKTTLITDFFNNYPNNKLWLYGRMLDDREKFYKKVSGLDRSDLLVIEDVFDNHPIVMKPWLRTNVKCNIIIITQSRKTCLNIVNHNSIPTRKNSVYEICNLNSEESDELIGAVIPKLTKETKYQVFSIAKGFPLFTMILADIFIHTNETEEDDFFFSKEPSYSRSNTEKLSIEELKSLVFQKWADLHYVKDLHLNILHFLSSVTNVGVSDSALMMTLSCKREILMDALFFLRRKGFITIQSFVDMSERIIIINPAISYIVRKQLTCEKMADYEDKYIQYLKDGVLGNHNYEKDVVQRLDYLIIKLQHLWEARSTTLMDQNNFVVELLRHAGYLDELLPNNCVSVAKSKWIAQIFQPYVAKNCSVVIPIARVICRLGKCEVLAEMMWQGVTNIYEDEPIPDSLARTCVIVSAFSHWSQIKNIDKNNIHKKVLHHLGDIYLLDNDSDLDMEIAALVGGLLSIGLIEEAIAITEDPRMGKQFPYFTFVFLVLVVGLLKHLKTMPKIFDVVKVKFPLTMESEAKSDVIRFLELKGISISLSSITCPRKYHKNVMGNDIAGTSRLVAACCQSADFDQFVIPLRGSGSWT